MLFFQVVLLLGYLYAHWLNHKLAPRRQAMVHTVVLAASLAVLPILPNPAWKTSAIARQLALSVRRLSLKTAPAPPWHGGCFTLFRKAARAFERRTNISAADDEEKQDKVLIGGLAVKLK